MPHTPGPWEYVLDDDGESCGVTFVIRMGSHLGGGNGWEPQHRIDYAVSSREESGKQFAEAEANARLIVATPDLLEALRRIREFSGDPVVENICDAAIAKAEGGQ